MDSSRACASVVVLLIGFLGFAAVAEGKVVFVATTGDDANDGLSWATAKLTVQAGLNAAVANDQVWVAAGTYIERITLKADVALYGGFAGNETDLTQRNWAVNKAILDGNAQGTVVTCPSGAGTSTRIDGITIRNGRGSPGGGMYFDNASPTIANNTIMGNQAGWFTGIQDSAVCCGGGIYSSGGSPTITGNVITDNRVDGYAYAVCSDDPDDCWSCGIPTFGGGIVIIGGSPAIANNSITANIATVVDLDGNVGDWARGGGIYCDTSSPTIMDNTIAGNTASGVGGGIYCTDSTPAIANNTISGNSGGGICCLGPSAEILNNVIMGNSTEYSGGGVYCYSTFAASDKHTIANNTITGNNADRGGGICCRGAIGPMMTNNTITGNTASLGGGICCDGLSPTIVNTIVAFNSSGILATDARIPTLRYSCVYGNAAYDYSGMTDPTGSNGNISVDPQLLAADYGEVHLKTGSPCIDAGDDTVVQAGGVDIDGGQRIQGTHVDIGADEFNGTQPPFTPRIVRVSSSGNDSNNGSTWGLAKRTVQAGIDAAAGAGGGDVWVAAGTYNERITLKLFVHAYGGFAGTETLRGDRDWAANVTVLDGNAGGSVVSALSGHGLSVVDGFTIRNGNATRGGGILCEGMAGPMIANNTITQNTAGNNSTGGGGGIYCASGSPTISNNTITRNTVNHYYGGGGGGIYCSSGSPMITDNMITRNNARLSGGGIYCTGSARIANNTLTANHAGEYGGGICCDGITPTIITNNLVAFNSSGIFALRSAPTLRCNCVYGNMADNYSGLPDATGTNGNISVDPKLADVIYDDNAHIQPDSPCKDAGDDTVVRSNQVDMDRQARIQGPHVDIGADESDATAWPTGPYVFVRVSPDGNDANDGSSWSSAKRTVQAGIAAASAVGGEVWVRSGTYPERITLLPYAHVYGGFAGTENTREERNWSTHVTILDGQQRGSVVQVSRSAAATNCIDGFTIRNGKGSYGGGIYCVDSSPRIANNTITGNIANYAGGGIYGEYSSSAISNNTIVGNSADSGGGICCIYGPSFIDNNRIVDNSADSGGGIYCFASILKITNNMIARNSAGGGGGMYCQEVTGVVANNMISGNTASGGSGVSCAINSTPTFSNNTITGNSSPGSGGAFTCCSYSDLTIVNTIIAFNSSGLYKGCMGKTIVRSCCVFGNEGYNYSGITDPTGTNGNISVDPRFVLSPTPGADGKWGTADDELGNLHLQSGSPCIDAGDNAGLSSGIVTDLAGLSRFFDDPDTADTGAGTPPIVDMGAYEYQPPLAIISAVSVKTHGAAGDMAINILAPDAVEPRAGGPTRLVVTFNYPIQAWDGSFDAGDEVTVSGGTIDALNVTGAELTIDLSGVPNATCLTVGLQGIAEDGSGEAMAPTALAVAVLLGDVNGDRYVNVLDLITVRNRISAPVAGDNFQCDVVASGGIDVLDLITVRNHNNTLVAETCPGFGQ